MTHDTAAPPEPTLRRGCRVGLDVGTVRIGVARSDPDGILATPYETVRREQKADVRRIAAIAAELDAACVYVGLPRTLRGGDSASTELARSLAADIAVAVAPVPVHLVDERLSTVDASRHMRASGRSAKAQRADIDAAAAAVILTTALEREKATGRRAGEPVAAPAVLAVPRPVPGARPGPPVAARPGPPPSGSVTPAPGAPPTPRPRKPRHRRGAAGPQEGTP